MSSGKNKKMKRKLENTKKIAEEYRPDSNSIETSDGAELSWKIKPVKDKVDLNFKFDKKFVEDDVEITVKIGGQVNYFSSPKGSVDMVKNVSFSATKKF
jgi:hypothetical protein